MADVVKIRASWERIGTDENGNMVFEHTSEVFGEQLGANSREELKDMMLARLAKEIHGDADAKREIERARVQAKLDAKQRL